MNVKTIEKDHACIAVVQSDKVMIADVQSSLDFIATVQYDTGCNLIALNKEAITEDFFRLDTRLAGDILQKFVNYQVKFAIIGDYSHYASKSLKDFIYESNHGKDIFFVSTVDEAIERLTRYPLS
ncbi:DUF4180 domain-containing protein [Clostridium aminobutyricum]|uniref:DUF4180 domain-containing protein n=1 Tax=Clostridium aminobutyricum TaxID=33953 RepID=A0A939D9P0_CLOAM|nr:DUF4180 domain-containing protein [Clostridium aminobutyricum]MBN7773632.1 DUF4180 domain-containing protein [Clostridium aminobutyricum]